MQIFSNLSSPHGGNIWRATELCKKKVIDFSANINPLGLAPGAKEAIFNRIEEVLHYPDPRANKATEALARYWDVSPESILPGNGSIELIYLIARAFTIKNVWIPSPTFSEYEGAMKRTGVELCFPQLKEEEGFRLDINGFNAEGGDILFICNPNNPTGNLVFESLEEVSERFPGCLVVVDEAFMDFLHDEINYTSIDKAVKSKDIIVLRTLTKFFALPGLRVGYLVGSPENVERIRRLQLPWSVNALAQIAVETSLDRDYIRRTREFIARERDCLLEELSRIKGLKTYPTVTNFILIRIEGGISSTELQHRLLDKGILIRDCSNFHYLDSRFIRIAVRTREENLLLINGMKDILL